MYAHTCNVCMIESGCLSLSNEYVLRILMFEYEHAYV